MIDINVVTGHLGDGKTLLLIMKMFEHYFIKRRIILCNFDVYKPIHSYKMHVPQLLSILSVLDTRYKYSLFIDESNTEEGLEATESMSNSNKAFGNFVTQLRKRQINLYYVSQWTRAKTIYNRLREKTDYEIKCRCIRNPDDDNDETNPILFYYQKVDNDTGEVIDKWIVPAPIAKMYYRFYKTDELFERVYNR